MSITNKTLQILRAITVATVNSSVGFASPHSILKEMDFKPKNIRTNLHRLVKRGLILRPYRGCFILSKEGRRVLNEALDRGN